jgi:hypothetical protein
MIVYINDMLKKILIQNIEKKFFQDGKITNLLKLEKRKCLQIHLQEIK